MAFSSVMGQNPKSLEVKGHFATNTEKFVSDFMGAVQLTAECRCLSL